MIYKRLKQTIFKVDKKGAIIKERQKKTQFFVVHKHCGTYLQMFEIVSLLIIEKMS